MQSQAILSFRILNLMGRDIAEKHVIRLSPELKHLSCRHCRSGLAATLSKTHGGTFSLNKMSRTKDGIPLGSFECKTCGSKFSFPLKESTFEVVSPDSCDTLQTSA
jgi:RNase P subunit RPR2